MEASPEFTAACRELAAADAAFAEIEVRYKAANADYFADFRTVAAFAALKERQRAYGLDTLGAERDRILGERSRALHMVNLHFPDPD